MNTIHLGNYEEFFILYMDNELSEGQVRMVDDFLAAHPDLRAELEMLMSTKLPLEQFSFDNKDLLAENMKLSSVDEELLLYIDNELPADQKKTVEIALAVNKDYQLQHQVLLQTKLNPLENIAYPNKKELYRSTERVISIRVWMRVAAAAVIIAIGGVVYFRNPPSVVPAVPTKENNQNTAVTNAPVQNQPKQNEPTKAVVIPPDNAVKNDVAVTNENNKKERKETEVVTPKDKKEENPGEKNLIAVVTPQGNDQPLERPKVNTVEFSGNENTNYNVVNTGAVTSLDPNRKTIKEPEEPIALTDNDRKGSLKGFLRKATRVIEKRTGIDPTNGNGDLLIGAVAINLK